jgi:hypothetical protein
VLVGDDWTGEYPEVDPDTPVTASDRVLLVPVIHAQDSDEFEGEYLKFAQAEVVVRRWEGTPPSLSPLQEVYRGYIELPAGTLTIGDADEWVTVAVSAGVSEVWVSYDEGASRDGSPARIWVDLAPASLTTPGREVHDALDTPEDERHEAPSEPMFATE